MKTLVSMSILGVFFLSGCAAHPWVDAIDGLERVTQQLLPPPLVPVHRQVAKGKPRIVQVRLVAEERKIAVTPDVTVHVSTFNGTVPGPLIVVHQDDYVELTLVNSKTSTFEHNIDFHASTGALGGGTLTKVKRAAMEGDKTRRLCLSLCTGRPHDPLSCGVRHEWGDHGLATRWIKG